MVPVDNTVNSVIFFERERSTLRVLCATVAVVQQTGELCPTWAQTGDHCEAISQDSKRIITFLGFSFCFRKQPSPALDSKRKSMGREGKSSSKAGRSRREVRRGGVDLSCSYRGAPALAMPSATFDLLCSFVYLWCWGLNLGPSACSALRAILSSTHASCSYQVISIMTELAMSHLL